MRHIQGADKQSEERIAGLPEVTEKGQEFQRDFAQRVLAEDLEFAN